MRQDLWLKELSEQYGLEFMTPIYLFYLIASTDTLINISEHIFRLYHFGSEINLAFLKRKDRGLCDRDVGSRATSLPPDLSISKVAEERIIVFLKKPLSFGL